MPAKHFPPIFSVLVFTWMWVCSCSCYRAGLRCSWNLPQLNCPENERLQCIKKIHKSHIFLFLSRKIMDNVKRYMLPMILKVTLLTTIMSHMIINKILRSSWHNRNFLPWLNKLGSNHQVTTFLPLWRTLLQNYGLYDWSSIAI